MELRHITCGCVPFSPEIWWEHSMRIDTRSAGPRRTCARCARRTNRSRTSVTMRIATTECLGEAGPEDADVTQGLPPTATLRLSQEPFPVAEAESAIDICSVVHGMHLLQPRGFCSMGRMYTACVTAESMTTTTCGKSLTSQEATT